MSPWASSAWAVFSPRAPSIAKIALWSWVVLIAASTVLIHQHHILDVVTGWLLAVISVKTVFNRPAGVY
jgi:membrane-associated phospholipid phosphatase